MTIRIRIYILISSFTAMAKVNVLHPGESIQNQDSSAGRKRSSFDLSHVVFSTSRFGEISSHFATNAIPGDHFSMKCGSDTESLGLKAPFLGTINKHEDYFFVPTSCLLPRNNELIITQPNLGDDVPEDAYTNIKYYRNTMATKVVTLFGYISQLASDPLQDYSDPDVYSYLAFSVFNYIMFVEALFSEGSLLNELGFHTANDLQIYDNATSTSSKDFKVDDYVEYLLNDSTHGILHMLTSIVVKDYSGEVYEFYSTPGSEDTLDFRDFVDWLRGNVCNLDFASGTAYVTLDTNVVASGTAFAAEIASQFAWTTTGYKPASNGSTADKGDELDLARILSYQMVCHHFYSNDSVDFIYSAELFRNSVMALMDMFNNTAGVPYPAQKNFVWNGVYVQYDVLSEKHLFAVLGGNVSLSGYGAFNITSNWKCNAFFQLISLIFNRKHSLRFVDMVTGLRTRPLAVGSTLVNVNNNTVDVVDVTRGILIQRFLNHVNRTGRKISDYVRGLFGTEPSRDICDPLFLAATQSIIYCNDIQNTGDAQVSDPNSRTARFQDHSASHGFEFSVHDYGVLIGVRYYDIRRPYAYSTDPLTHVRTRYDLFNPFLENSGDQGLQAIDVCSLNRTSAPFGYHQRYSEYKMSLDRCIGGFVKNLPGFALPYTGLYFGLTVNPDTIRSWNREIDPLFISLTGVTMAKYFHFYHKTSLSVIASREMSSDAKIL